MTFLNPILALVGLACVAIPIIIHILMRKRRRPIPWGAMRFIIEAYRQQRRRLNLEQLLLLAARCILVALLALAVGKPIVRAAGAPGQRGPRTLFILLDNSLTSTAADTAANTAAKSALDTHKAAAQRLLGELDQSRGDRVGIIALGAPADPLILPPTAELSAAAAIIRELAPTESRCDLAGALARLKDARAIESSGEHSPGSTFIALLSDLRVGSIDVEQSLAPLAAAVKDARLVVSRPAQTPLSNVAIVDATPLESVLVGTTGQNASLPIRVTLKRSGEDLTRAAATKVRIEAFAPGKVGPARAAERAVSWKPGEESTSVTITIEVSPEETTSRSGALILRASIDRDAIVLDGALTRTIEARDRLAVALLAPPPPAPTENQDFVASQWLALALSPADDGTLRTRRSGDIAVTRLDPARDLLASGTPDSPGPLANFDAVIIPEPQLLDSAAWKRVRAAANAGAAILVFPPARETVHAWGDAFAAAMDLDVRIAREARGHASPARLTLAAPSLSEHSRLLAMLAGEFDDLSKSISVNRSLPVEVRAGSMTSALTLDDATPAILLGAPGSTTDASSRPPSRGIILLSTIALDLSWTNLPARPLMVPLVQELVRQSVGIASAGTTLIAGQPASFPSGAVELAPFAPADSASIPINAATALRRAGLFHARDASGVTLGVVSVRPDIAASSVDPRSEDEVSRALGAMGAPVEWLSASLDSSSGTQQPTILSRGPEKPPASFPLLLGALLVALAEVAMARYFSHARADEAVVPAGEGRAAA